MTDIGIRKDLTTSYEATLAAVPAALKEEGFGVLTEIDVAQTLKQKINVDFRRYKILGACNPAFAHRALSATLDAGVMLPCNVIVFERDGGGSTVIAVDPMQTVAVQLGGELEKVAREVRAKLERVIARLG